MTHMLARRTPLKTKTPLRSKSTLARGEPMKRKAPVKRKRSGPPRKGRERDPAYLAWIRSLPCLVPGCKARDIEAHHYGRRGVGQKCDDRESSPLCGNHHRAWWHDRACLPGMSTEESRQAIKQAGQRLREQYEENERCLITT